MAAAVGRPDSARAVSSPVGPTSFTGYAFDTCAAPSEGALNAWRVSPYRAVGIYIGGVNRACPDGNLSPTWVAAAVAGGWNLVPLYVGLQAPCVQQRRLELIDPSAAAAQGEAAAEDAAVLAAGFGLGAGSPLYFDMEGYRTDDASCSETVQEFLAAWVSKLRSLGFVPGVYGSAASTIRDLVASSSTGLPSPGDVWIANWNGRPAVFGDPYVPDSLWSSHQRLHQYKGGHEETYGGVTIAIDSDYVDAMVVGPATPAPVVPPLPAAFPAGSVGSGDGHASASWPTGAFTRAVVVTLTPSQLQTASGGFAAGGYLLTLRAVDASTGAAVTNFGAPLTIHIVAATASGLVPAFSADGTVWAPLSRMLAAGLRADEGGGYRLEADGSVDVLTSTTGVFGLLHDVQPPTPPSLAARFVKGALVLSWRPAVDNSRVISSYVITFEGRPLRTQPGSEHESSLRTFDPAAPSVYRLIAVDASGNASAASQPVVVVPRARPTVIPWPLPAWAWPLLHWQQQGRRGSRPPAPQPLPAWYWDWAGWRLQPFRIQR